MTASLASTAKRLASALRTWVCPPISRRQAIAIASAELERRGDRASCDRSRACKRLGIWDVDFRRYGLEVWVVFRIDATTRRILSEWVAPR